MKTKRKPPVAIRIKKLVLEQFTPGQRALALTHGTPAEFAIACYQCVPGEISMDEAEIAAQKYRREFLAA